MKCPICKQHSLEKTVLANALEAHKCQRCEGIWVSSTHYFTWLRIQNTEFPDKDVAEEKLPTWDTMEAKVCPDCGHLLARYKVLPNVEFFLDHCGSCNGVWFDKEEWRVLEESNLHDNINQFFTRPWQQKIHEEEAKKIYTRIYREKFGDEDYERIVDIRQWIRQHPQMAMLMAYLQADDPYRA